MKRALAFLKRRLCERSTYTHLLQGVGAAGAFYTGNPAIIMFTLLALTAVGFLTPDGRVKQ